MTYRLLLPVVFLSTLTFALPGNVSIYIPHECPILDYDAFYDLKTKRVVNDKDVTVVYDLIGNECQTRGVLKLSLASSGTDRRRVLIDLFFGQTYGWLFNLGDSISNHGYGFDLGNQSNNAEVVGVFDSLRGYKNDYTDLYEAFYELNVFSTRLTLIAGDGHLVWLSDLNYFNYYYSPYYFALNGQADEKGPVNYDLYLGINRVISSEYPYNVGRGLCKVGIKFLPQI
ncbi:uncharacterized protein LOC131931107 [Physella acuta]|uniref:uncharacterized protein LOC131931107 n=1 Tax=Physella acuta TaxID=109671 RepID=UPI0027DC5A04|nr:uncharacterized protein LOC131931107 [Physella acuta]